VLKCLQSEHIVINCPGIEAEAVDLTTVKSERRLELRHKVKVSVCF
jgi:hypothetical protein